MTRRKIVSVTICTFNENDTTNYTNRTIFLEGNKLPSIKKAKEIGNNIMGLFLDSASKLYPNYKHNKTSKTLKNSWIKFSW
jgi:hypothetical protein